MQQLYAFQWLCLFVTCSLLATLHVSNAQPVENALSDRLLVSFGEQCDETVSAERVLSSLLLGQARRQHQAGIKQEEGVLATERVADFAAYSRNIFSLKTPLFVEANAEESPRDDWSGLTEPEQAHAYQGVKTPRIPSIVRCSISQTTLKLVGVSVVSLEACPLVEPSTLKRAFQQDSCIVSVEYDSIVRLESSLDGEFEENKSQAKKPPAEYWQSVIDLESSKALGTCRREVIIGVIDSGVEYAHPALQPNIWVNANEVPANGVDDDKNGYVDDVHGYNFLDRNGDPKDDHGHGTHVAGIISAVPENTGVSGVCGEISVAALRFINKHGIGTVSLAIEALNYAVQMGFQVSSNSWGGSTFSYQLRRAIARANKANHLFVTAAGNKGIAIDFVPEYPAALNLPNVITVAATDEHDRLAKFSNYGRMTVHVAAPGVNIRSTYPPDTSARLSGTSMATPIVAAVSALLFSVKRTTVVKVRHAILSSVDKLPQLRSRVKTGGRVNAAKALKLFLDDSPKQVRLAPFPETSKLHAALPCLSWLERLLRSTAAELFLLMPQHGASLSLVAELQESKALVKSDLRVPVQSLSR